MRHTVELETRNWETHKFEFLEAACENPSQSFDPPSDMVGGYINPYDMLADEGKADEVVRAAALLEAFIEAAKKVGALEVG